MTASSRLPALLALAALTALPPLGSPAHAGELRGQASCAERCAEIVVFLEGAPASSRGAPAAALLDQVGRAYTPPVVVVRAGATVTLRNSDPELHNVHVYRDDKTVFNLAIPFTGMTIDRVLEAPGTYEVRCDVHPEMLAYLVTLEHPYFAIPDPEGRFAIADVPAGTYTLVRYDPHDGSRREEPIEVDAGPVEVSF